ncbi:MAG: hypothetical protein GC137_03690 [Alphaproteobacteria bacterium]|nr:hypothetical protein [Alphaproteobacteria bacterium]
MTFIRLSLFLLAFVVLLPSAHAQEATEEPESLSAEEEQVVADDEQEIVEVFGQEINLEDEEDDRVLTMEEAQELIYQRPAANDAIKGGEVPLSELGIYNIYARQLAYRESARKFRASLEARRESFEAPRTAVVEEHREIVDKVYAAESAAFQKAQKNGSDQNEESRSAMIEENQQEAKKDNLEKMDMAKTDISDDEYEGNLKELPIPSEDETVNRKVVTDPEAPDFDPSKL